MATTVELQELQRILENAFRMNGRPIGGTVGEGASPSERAAAAKERQILKDNSSALRYLQKTLKKNGELLTDMTHVTKASNKAFYDVVNSVSDLKELEKLPGTFKRAMDKSGSIFVKTMSENMDSLEDMFAAQGKIEKLPDVKALMDEFARGKIGLNQLGYKIEELGYSAEEATMVVEKFDRNIMDASGYVKKYAGAQASANGTVRKFDEEIKDANTRIRDFGTSIDVNKEKMKSFGKKVGAVAVLLGKELFDAAQASMRFGTELNLIQSRLAGMSPEEFSQMQAQNRQAINAMSGGFDTFNSLVGDASHEMVLYTGSLKAGAQLAANLVTTSRMMGNASVDTASFVKSQQDVFKSFNRQLSMTSDEFAAMNDRLIQDSDIRAVLYRQSGKERQAHFEGLQMQVQTYRTWGLLQDQAEALAKTMDKMSGKDARTRMKEAARLRATMGAMGMGEQGAEAQRIMLKGARATDTERQNLAEILKKANEVTSSRMGESFQSELLTSAMIQRAGIEEYLGPNSSLVNATLAVGAEQKNVQDATAAWMGKLDGVAGAVGTSGENIVKAITDAKLTLVSFLGSGFIAALMAAMATTSFGKGIMAFAKNAISGGSRMLGSAAAGISGTAVAGVAAAGAGGYAAGTLINQALEAWAPKFHSEMVDVVGGTLSNIFDKSVGQIWSDTTSYWGDQLSGIFGDEGDRKEETKTLDDTLKKINETLEQGNAVASKTAENTAKTQKSIEQQTVVQQDEADKTRQHEKTKLRQYAMRVPRGVSPSL